MYKSCRAGCNGYSNVFNINAELLYDETEYSIYNAHFSPNVNRTRFDKNTTERYVDNKVIKNILINGNTASFDVSICDGDEKIISNTGYYNTSLYVNDRIETIGSVNCRNNSFNAKNEVILNEGFQVDLGNTFYVNTSYSGCE